MGTPDDTMHRRMRRYWPRVRLLSGVLLAAWFLLTFLFIFFARELTDANFFGWPISFYMAAQGLVLFYLAVIGIYAACMRRLDRSFGNENNNGK